MEYPFYDSPNTATIICSHVVHDNLPILYVSHDEDDGMWQFLCGNTHEIDDAILVSLVEVFNRDNTIGLLKDLPLGYFAVRKDLHDNWTIKRQKILLEG